ncbi:hypothetical protein GDO81_000129 [Engystomops pustulosus]|uniref:Uncharacterized protein n=1 Tax=Engystomops pustulosus TaxID=76066 RepID=A0AAV7D1M5_ENGPU|nr:hypothetical protein GDO81_000129 [Engystomops pustulosus]
MIVLLGLLLTVCNIFLSRCPYGSEVFRSCRKHSYDSEPGEEDTGGPQLQRTIRAPNNTPLGTPSGDSDTLLASSLHTTPSTITGLSQTDEFSDWSGSQQTVVERDSKNARQGFTQGVGARHLGVEPLIPASSNNLPGSVWGSEVSLSGFSDLYSSAFSLYRGRSCAIRV